MTTTAPAVQPTPPPTPPPAPPPVTAKKPRKGRRWLIAIGAVVVLLVGTAGVAGAVLWNSVELGTPVTLPATTTVYYSDGTVLATLSENRRYELAYDEIDSNVRDVAVAAEDPGFWSDAAGPITRAVIRTDYDLRGDANNVRLRTYVMARKAESVWGKEEVLRRFLNDIPFGRDSFGIEAAARAFFNKSASAGVPQEQRLTTAETMYLLTLVREPYPADAVAAQQRSQARWEEIRAQLVSQGMLSAPDAQALTYPTPVAADVTAATGLDRPAGLVVPQIIAELTQSDNADFHGMSWQSIREGGYDIVTTLDSRAQAALESAVDETVPASVLYGQPDNLQAAGVVIEPGTGRVLAYYGGHDGVSSDFAGVYRNEQGEFTGVGAHPAGASFGVQVLAAALGAGYSMESRWLWTPHPAPGRDPQNPVTNRSTCPTVGTACTLRESVQRGLAVPLYDLTTTIGPLRVLTAAADAGFDTIWNGTGTRYDLRTEDLGDVVRDIGFEVGIGEFPVTVVDQANAMATFAALGLRTQAHFVERVMRADQVFYGETLPSPNDPRVLNHQQVNDLSFVLSQRAGRNDLAIQSGGWGSGADLTDVWSLGYSTELAAAIWIGNRADQRPLRDNQGASIEGAGLPTYALLQTLDTAQSAMGLTPSAFPPPSYTGDVNPPGSIPS